MSSPEGSPHAHLAAAFARAFPALADHLDAPIQDPEVERLVEGYVELASRVDRVITASSARSAQFYASMFCPEILRPFPAATILELSPRPGAPRTDVAAGAEFDSGPIEGTRCRFRAHAPFALVPYRVSGARLVPRSSGGAVLEVQLQSTGPRTGAVAEPSALFPLRLHLAGDRRSSLLLVSWLHQHLGGVEVEIEGKKSSLGRQVVQGWGFARDQALLPSEPLEHPGIRLVRELLVLSAKFAFVEINGPTELAPRDGKATLRLAFEVAPPPSVRVDAESVRTNCVPVVNVFGSTADPIEPSLERPEEIIRPAGIGPEQGEVYMVRDVRARLDDGRSFPLAPTAGFGAGARDALPGVLYATYCTPSATVPGHDVTLTLSTPPDTVDPPGIHVLSLDLWATQRNLPSALGVGAVTFATPASPPDATFRNIRALTPYRPAPQGELLAYHALALVSLSFRPLASPSSIQALLAALDLHAQHDVQAARSLEQRLEALAAIRATPTTIRPERVTIHGNDIEIELLEGTFDGDGEAFVFARVLAHLFAYEAPLNTFARTTARLVSTGRIFRFPALHGERSFG